MKKVLVAVAALAVLAGCKNGQTANANDAGAAVEGQETAVETVVGDIVFVQLETVLTECELYKTEGVALRDKTEKAQNSWAQKERNLQNEMAQLQEKYQKGLITTRDAQQKEQELQKRAENYQTSVQNEAKNLEEENIVFNNRLNDLIQRAVADINSARTYKMIVNGSALLDADPALDITQTVLAKVNELYAADKANEKK